MTEWGWALLAGFGLLVVLASWLAYPWIEEHLIRKVQNYFDWANNLSTRMFLPIRKKTIAVIVLGSTLIMATMGYLVSRGYQIFNIIFTLIFAWLGWSLLRVWLNLRWQQRLSKFDNQLIDGLNLMANSLKSGLNLAQSIQVLVKEMPDPLSQEFGVVLSQEKLGLTLDEALEKMLERIPSQDLSVAIHSVLILRETGGDLSETFEVIASRDGVHGVRS